MNKNQVEGQRPKILWIGKSLGLREKLDDLSILFRDQIADLDFTPEVIHIEAQDLIRSRQLLEQAKNKFPESTLLVSGENLAPDLIRTAINDYQVYKIVDKKFFTGSYKSLLSEASQVFSKNKIRKELGQESRQQIRELEVLNRDLEQIVVERTGYIEKSQNEEEEKLNKSRSLIRLIKDLSVQSSFEEWLVILRREIRKIRSVGDPLLILQTSNKITTLISFRAGQVVISELNKTLNMNEVQLGRELANHFGRPFLKLISLPIELHLSQALAWIVVENTNASQGSASFQDFMSERMQPISMTLDRLILEYELTKYAYRWEQTFDHLKDPVAIIDVDYEVLRANKKFTARNFNKKCYQAFAQRETPCEGCPLPQALTDQASAHSQIQVGSRRMEVYTYPIRMSSDPQSTTVVNQYIDVTQKQELYMKVVQSEKMGAIGLLAGNIAHELNNPLTGLRSLAQVLTSTLPEQDPYRSDLIEIEKAAARSQQVIRNLLDFSRNAEEGVVLSTFDDVVNKTLPMLKTILRPHRVQIDLNSQSKKILVHPHLLQQVVFNLVNNACQAMSEPGELSVTTEVSEGHVQLNIGDTGPGIPEENLKRIFEPFFTTKKEGAGTGLGLSLSKKIIESYQGQIAVKNRSEGKGVIFSVKIPFAKGET